MPQSKSYNELCLKLAEEAGLIGKLKNGKYFMDAGLVEYEFFDFCDKLKEEILKENFRWFIG